MEIKTTIEVV